jgi:hypothetical protein
MNTILCILLWILVPAIAIVAFVNWVSETREDRIVRWNKSGISQMAISKRLNISRYQVRKVLAQVA